MKLDVRMSVYLFMCDTSNRILILLLMKRDTTFCLLHSKGSQSGCSSWPAATPRLPIAMLPVMSFSRNKHCLVISFEKTKLCHQKGEDNLTAERVKINLGQQEVIFVRVFGSFSYQLEFARQSGPSLLTPPPPLSLSLSLDKLEILNWLGLDLLQSAVRFLKRCRSTSGSACS